MGFANGQTAKEEKRAEQLIEVVHTRLFSAGPGGGNPCPVILAADHLEARQMQALSQKFGLDTVFILKPQSRDADIRLRYFVPDHEMGVSGHATIAAITVAMSNGRLKSEPVRVETLNGIFAVSWVQNRNQLLVTLEQNPPSFGPAVSPSMVAQALRIGVGDIACKTPVESVSVSRPKLLVPLADSGVLDTLEPDFDALWALCEAFRVTGVYPFTRNTDKANADVEARQFPLRAGFPEDATTGLLRPHWEPTWSSMTDSAGLENTSFGSPKVMPWCSQPDRGPCGLRSGQDRENSDSRGRRDRPPRKHKSGVVLSTRKRLHRQSGLLHHVTAACRFYDQR